MPKTSNKAATKIDKLVGTNIRVHRLAAGLSQEELGAKLGVTFQQIQKYEKGANRVGSGRLYQIAEILEVPVKSFYAGGAQQKDTRTSSPFDLLADALTMQMAREFGKMTDNKMRRAILAAVEAMVAYRGAARFRG
jgi:transcriptional regulator with XRE-family HTH domain